MAEVLVTARDRNVADSAGRWHKGMAVVVMPDGHKWGKRERPPRFVVLKLPQLTVEEAKAIFLPEDEELLDEGTKDEKRRMYARRRHTLDDKHVDSALRAVGSVTLNKPAAALVAQDRKSFERDIVKRPPLERETMAGLLKARAARGAVRGN